MTTGNLEIKYLTDFGRVLQSFDWGSIQTARDTMGFGFIGLVVDHDGYNHSPGAENIADAFTSFPYASQDDFITVDAITMVVDNPTMQKSTCSFRNEGAQTGDPLDIEVNQTAWSIVNKDWAIIQWRVTNIKGTAITGLTFSVELALSKDGARYGVGGDTFDGGDDFDGFDNTDKIYWAQDNDTGTCLGFASAEDFKPINHYFSQDYHALYDDYKNFWENDAWLYQRINAPNSLEGDVVMGNRTSNIGWSGVSISPGSYETFTLIIAANNTFGNMKTAVNDARYYYENLLEESIPPSAPVNPIASAGLDFINISWNPPLSDGGETITNYRIYRGTSPGSETFYVEIGNVTTFNDTGVSSGNDYYYRVSAVNSIGEGALSDEVNAMPFTYPSAPMNLAAEAGGGYVNLSWDVPASDGGTPVTGYYIYRNGTTGAYDFIPPTKLWFNDTMVLNGLTYSYNISAVNQVGEGANATISATPISPTMPSTIENLQAGSGLGYIDLFWNPPSTDGGSPIIAYRIYKGTTSGSETFYMEIGNITSFNDSNVTSGMTYYYKVSAVNSIDEGPLSNVVSATAPDVPLDPQNLDAVSGLDHINLSWDVPLSDGGSPITNYKIFRGTSSGSEAFQIMIGNVTTYNDTNVSSGSTYFYRIGAVNMVGDGVLSSEVSATVPKEPTAPLDPTTTSGNEYIHLLWKIPSSNGGSPITGYNIYRQGTQGIYVSVPGSQLWYNDTNVVNGVIYTYFISAINEVGEGPNATVIGSPLTPIYPSPPTNIIPIPGGSWINLTWDPPSDGTDILVKEYNVYRNGTNGIYATVPYSQPWFVDNNVTPGTIYTYQISSVGDDGEGDSTIELILNAGTKPSMPTGVTISTGDSYVHIIWTEPDSDGGYPITNYSIYRGVVSGEEEFLISIENETSYNDTDVENGITYFYRIIAINTIGESELSNRAEATPFVINRLPSVTITSPLPLTTIKGKFEVLGISSDLDNPVQRVEIKIGEENWERVDGTSSWSYEWDTTSVPNGLHTITVRSFDGSDYSPESNVTILVDNQKSERDPMDGVWIWILVVIVAIVFVLLYVIWSLKKKLPRDMPDDQIYEIIQQKFEEGEISEETFEDFKRRYKTD